MGEELEYYYEILQVEMNALEYYYEILQVEMNATGDEIRKAFLNLAMKWHPDKHCLKNKKEAEAKFKQISEAYNYLKNQLPLPDYYEILQVDKNVSANYIKTAYNKLASIWGPGTNSDENEQDKEAKAAKFKQISEAYKILHNPVERFHYDNGHGRTPIHKLPKVVFHEVEGTWKVKSYSHVPPFPFKLYCSLEQLYTGVTKRLKFTSKTTGEEEILTIEIKPGSKERDGIVLPRKGIVVPDMRPGDAVIVIYQMQHPVFRRFEDDLFVHLDISLAEALSGHYTVNLTTLDGRNLTVPIEGVIDHNYEKVVVGEGMPLPDEPSRRGNLTIKFYRRGQTTSSPIPPREKAPPVEIKLYCSLEELYRGATKRMRVSNDIPLLNGEAFRLVEILPLEVKPGLRKGTKITFSEEVKEKWSVILTEDVVFIIEEKQHQVFTRDGDDLVVEQEIPLAEALTGYTVHLTTLDKRNLTVPINGVIHPNYQEVGSSRGRDALA